MESQLDIEQSDIHEVPPRSSEHEAIQDGSNITAVSSEHGVITRSKRRMMARSALGKFHGVSKESSQTRAHSHFRKAEVMSGSSCFFPLLFLGIYAALATLVIAVLSYFLHHVPGSSSLTSFSGEDGAKCVEVPQYSTTNLDILNVDVSSRKIMDTAQGVKCNCEVDWKTVLEWGIFEIVSVLLLVCIFCWLCVGDGLGQCKSFLKKMFGYIFFVNFYN